jgi:hypothetical protein
LHWQGESSVVTRGDVKEADAAPAVPNTAQRAWLARGLEQPGGKLPLFDRNGQRVSPRTVKACLEHGWAEPWFSNPLKPDWLICKLTPEGRRVATRG